MTAAVRNSLTCVTVGLVSMPRVKERLQVQEQDRAA
jgi:hypothetical protein